MTNHPFYRHAMREVANLNSTSPEIIKAEMRRDTDESYKLKAQVKMMLNVMDYYFELGVKSCSKR